MGGDRDRFIGIRGADVIEQDKAKVALRVWELQRQTAVAIEELAPGRPGRFRGESVRVCARSVRASIVNATRLGIPCGSMAAHPGTGEDITPTAFAALVAGWARARLVWGRWLVTGARHPGAAHSRGGSVNHAIRTNQRVLPGGLTQQASVADQRDGLSNQSVETLECDVDLLFLIHEEGITRRVLA